MLNTATEKIQISAETDVLICEKLWKACIPSHVLTDLWEVRQCFHRFYKRSLFFLLAKEDNHIVGFLPLSYIEEHDRYAYFPGEVWQGRTWLEQNMIFARDQQVFHMMLDWVRARHGNYDIRYLCEQASLSSEEINEDESGYIFNPSQYDFSIENYFEQFPRKSLKVIRREIERMTEKGIDIRWDQYQDFDQLVVLNRERYGVSSYFEDSRFRQSFYALRDLLLDKGWLKMLTIYINGQFAAVDLGCVYQGVYTLLAGGTSTAFPGAAKIINLEHLKHACDRRYRKVDFLCGDFSWKRKFQLTPEMLFQLSNISKKCLSESPS